MIAKAAGLFLVAEGVSSYAAFKDQNALFQLGRLTRVGIGFWLLAK